MRIGKHLIILGVLLAGATPAYSQLTLEASVDRNSLAVGEKFTLSVTVSGNVSSIPSPNMPQLKGFSSYSSGSITQHTNVNGAISRAVINSYVLMPLSAGKHIIPAITVNYEGKTYTSAPIEINVVAAGTRPPPAVKARPAGVSGSKGDIFITTTVDKSEAYVNEQVQLTFSFYQRVRLIRQAQYTPPDTTGFITDDLPPQREYRAKIDGREYKVTEIKTALFPISAGNYTIGKAFLKCTVEDNSRSQDDFFRGFFSRGKSVALESKPISIKVLPLPSKGKPANFTGAVGQYSIASKVDKKKLKTGEALTFTVEVSGVGNVKAISEPSLSMMENFRRYETVTSSNKTKDGYRVQGSKSYSTVLSPIVSGKVTIPPVKFSFFDPAKKVYRSVSSRPQVLEVEQGEEAESSATLITPEGIKFVSKDIRYIKTDCKLKDRGNLIYRKAGFLYFHFIPPFIFLGLLVFSKRQDKLNRDVGYARRARASGLARKRLKKARELLGRNDTESFYGALAEGITKFIGDKLNVSAAGITMAQLEEKLKEKGVAEAVIKDVREVLSASDYARFAPSGFDGKRMQADYEMAERIITGLQKAI